MTAAFLLAASLSSLLSEAESSHPALAAAAERRIALEREPERAGTLPDPELSFSIRNESLDRFTLGDSPMSNVEATWTQPMPREAKRRTAGEVARAELEAAASAESDLRATIRARVKQAWIELARVDRTRSIVEENRKVMVVLRDAARVRYENGGGLLENVLNAGAAIARLDLELSDLDRARALAEARLGEAVGRAGPATFDRVDDFPEASPWDGDELERLALDRSTTLALARSRAELGERRVDAARTDLKTDWAWRAGYAERGGLDSIVSGGVSFRLPIRADRGQRLTIARREHEAEAAREDVDAAVVEIVGKIRAASAQARYADRNARLIETEILPQARAAYDAAQAAYQNGRADFATVFDDFLSLLDDARRLETLRAGYLASLASLEPLTGAELVLPGAP